MSKKFLFSIIIVLVITNLAALLYIQKKDTTSEEGLDGKGAVAIVDNEPIHYKEWMEELKKQHGKKQLEQMIHRTVVERLAKEHDIHVDEKIVDREIAYRTVMAGILSEDEYTDLVDLWREDIIFRYQLEQLLTLDISIQEGEIKHHYDRYKDEYDFASSLQLSHILVADMETAKKVKEELDQGAVFSLLAQEYSLDEETKDIGGYMGFLPTTSKFLPDSYVEQAMGMKENTYSEPIPVDSGVALIFLHRKLDTVEFTYDELKPYIHSELALKKENLVPSAEELWEQFEISWIYEAEK